MSVMLPNYPIRFRFAPDIVMWRVVAACPGKSMAEPAIFLVDCGLTSPALPCIDGARDGRPSRPSGVILAPWLTVY
jgi:hypothetical protein